MNLLLSNKMKIEKLSEVTELTAVALSELLLQLSSRARSLSTQDIQQIVDSGNTNIFIAKVEDVIVGTFSLVIYTIPTGKKAIIEDVVVDANKRGLKIGENMIRFAIDYATSEGVRKIELTSNPQRIAANTLYQKMGFVKRDTNFYRLKIE